MSDDHGDPDDGDLVEPRRHVKSLATSPRPSGR